MQKLPVLQKLPVSSLYYICRVIFWCHSLPVFLWSRQTSTPKTLLFFKCIIAFSTSETRIESSYSSCVLPSGCWSIMVFSSVYSSSQYCLQRSRTVSSSHTRVPSLSSIVNVFSEFWILLMFYINLWYHGCVGVLLFLRIISWYNCVYLVCIVFVFFC